MLDFTLAWSAASGCVLHAGTTARHWSACGNPVICAAQFSCQTVESRCRGNIHRLEQRPKKTQLGQKVCGKLAGPSELFARAALKRRQQHCLLFKGVIRLFVDLSEQFRWRLVGFRAQIKFTESHDTVYFGQRKRFWLLVMSACNKNHCDQNQQLRIGTSERG